MTERVSIDRLRELFDYDPEAGLLTWRVSNSARARVGAEAGAIGANGRRYVGVEGQRILAHRIAWAITHGEWPDGNIAPDNGDYLDLRLVNLKCETAAETARKGGLRKTNTTGTKGVSFDKTRGKWMAYIDRDYRRRTLGRFSTQEEAAAVAQRAAEEYGLAGAREREIARDEVHRRAKTHGIWRARWQRLRHAHPTNGWLSLDHLIETVGEPMTNEHRIVPRDPDQMIGPDNFVWRVPARLSETKEGRAELNRVYRRENATALREKNLIRDFGIDLAEYQRMFVEQGGVCAICKLPEVSERNGKAKWMAVDHDHTTGAVRALLCSNCNPMLGYAKDDPARLRAAADYLDSYAVPENVVPLKKDTA